MKKRFFASAVSASLAALTAMAGIGDGSGDGSGNPGSPGSAGTVHGRVMDADRQTLPGATVLVEDLHTGVASDMNGYYALANLKPGTYRVRVSYVGYEPREFVVAYDGRSVERNFVLSANATIGEVVVNGAFYGQRKALQVQ